MSDNNKFHFCLSTPNGPLFDETETLDILHDTGLEGLGDPTVYWDVGSTLNIHFLTGQADWQRFVADTAREWTKYANLEFRFFFDPNHPPRDEHGNNIADIAIDAWRSGGGWSYLGTNSRWHARSGRASMMLPDFKATRTTLHEFGHALGLNHEHLSPEADINWNKEQVYKDAASWWGWSRHKVEWNIFRTYSADSSEFTAFDPDSIMIYQIPNSWTWNDFSVGLTRTLSQTDKEFIKQVYPVTGGARPDELLGWSGWGGPIAVEGEYVYLVRGGDLWRGKIASNNTIAEKIGQGGWNGPIAVDNGWIYLASNGDLRRGRLGADNVVTTRIGFGGWQGHLAVDRGWVYLVKNGDLHRGQVADNVVLTETIGRGGWNGPIAVSQGQIYTTRFSELLGGPILTNTVASQVGTGGWNGYISADNGYVYLANGRLHRGRID